MRGGLKVVNLDVQKTANIGDRFGRHTSKDYLEKKNHKNSLFDCAVNEQHNLSERKWLNLSERYSPDSMLY